MRLVHQFPPVAPRGARVLVLGMFPSAASIAAGGYCGHPRNAFWSVMADVLGTPWLADPPGWPVRYMALRLNRVALWDVVAECERADPSSDQGITVKRPSDVRDLLSRMPDIRGILLNGRAAGDVFARMIAPDLRDDLRVTVCPSTSPRLPVPLKAKAEAWRRAFAGAVA